jgi:hypothetical protein
MVGLTKMRIKWISFICYIMNWISGVRSERCIAVCTAHWDSEWKIY